MRVTTFKLRIDLATGVADILRSSRNLASLRLGPLPERLRKVLEQCLELKRVPEYANIVGIEKVSTVDGLTEVDIVVCPLNLNAMEMKGFTDRGEREKISYLHDDIFRWITQPLPTSPGSSAERTKRYRDRLREDGRQIIELRPKNEHVNLLREINRALSHDVRGALAKRFKNLIDRI